MEEARNDSSQADGQSYNAKKEVILEDQRVKKKVHLATLMDICHLKNAESEPKLQEHRGRVVLRGGFVKDDSGGNAVSASQMTAAKVMDVIARQAVMDKQLTPYPHTVR